jgi:hypothetical protein
MILESFDRQTLAKMEIALEQACGVVLSGGQKHRSRRYIAKRIIACASNGHRELDSLTTAAVAAAEELNASREQKSAEVITSDIGGAHIAARATGGRPSIPLGWPN